MGEEDRFKLSSDVLCLARPVLLSSLQLKGTVDFCIGNHRMLFLEFLYQLVGLQPWILVLHLGLSTGHILQIQFSVCPRHLASHSVSVCNRQARLTWPPALMEVLPTGDNLWALTLVDTGVCIIISPQEQGLGRNQTPLWSNYRAKGKGQKLVQEQWDCVGELDSHWCDWKGL